MLSSPQGGGSPTEAEIRFVMENMLEKQEDPQADRDAEIDAETPDEAADAQDDAATEQVDAQVASANEDADENVDADSDDEATDDDVDADSDNEATDEDVDEATDAASSETAARLEIAATVEAILFSTDTPISPAKLAMVGELPGRGPVKEAIAQLNERYDAMGSAFRIESIAGGYQMLTRPEYHDVVRRLFKNRSDSKLSHAAMETLAIIAYRQPILRADVEAIRGVASGEMIRNLLDKNLVKITGRAEVLGRPMLYGTTRRFLEIFGLNSIEDLPNVEALRGGRDTDPSNKSAKADDEKTDEDQANDQQQPEAPADAESDSEAQTPPAPADADTQADEEPQTDAELQSESTEPETQADEEPQEEIEADSETDDDEEDIIL